MGLRIRGPRTLRSRRPRIRAHCRRRRSRTGSLEFESLRPGGLVGLEFESPVFLPRRLLNHSPSQSISGFISASSPSFSQSLFSFLFSLGSLCVISLFLPVSPFFFSTGSSQFSVFKTKILKTKTQNTQLFSYLCYITTLFQTKNTL
jgi:hypothetical protein